MAFRAGGLAPVTALQHAILYLVLVFLDHVEEGVYGHLVVYVLAIVARQPVPQLVFLLLCELVVRLEYGEVALCGTAAELVLPYPHLIAVPAHHAAVVYTERRVGYDQFLVDAYHLAETLAFGACPDRRVEREHVVRRFFESHPVGFKLCREVVAYHRWQEHEPATAVAFVECCLGRVYQPRCGVFGRVYRQAVDDEVYVVGLGAVDGLALQKVLYPCEVTTVKQPCVTLQDIGF